MAETYYSLTDIVKLCDNLIAALPPSFYSGIMAVRGGLATAPAADVVPVVLFRDCKHRDPEDKKCDCGGLEHAHMFPVADDWFCADGERKDGDGE